MLLQPVILSGGSGTRLWPLSREKHPKQLLSLFNGETMLQATASRVRSFHGEVAVSDKLIVVCNEEYRFITAEQLQTVGFENCTLLLEPIGRNTAPAVTLAAIAALDKNEDSVLLIMPADHNIADTKKFHEAVAAGLPQAIQGAMVTFGIVPNHPNTGYGYIEIGETLEGSSAVQLRNFVEKPNVEVAQSYVDSGKYVWNSGIFMMRASIWLKAIRHFNPAMFIACEAAYANANIDIDFVRISKQHFSACPSDSIDYAVMEKLSTTPELQIGACVVPFDAGWSDVGAWDAVWEVSEKDQHGNSKRGDILAEDTRNSLLISDSRLVACLGLDDVIVVETPDAVLVTNKANTSNIKRIITRLKEQNYAQTDNHRKVYRPWGHYDSVDRGEHFQVKRIVVKPGGSLSMQMHQHRAEHWIVVTGTARVTRNDEVMTLKANESTYIPIGAKHRLENPGDTDLEVIEVQSGTYLGEDDIVRFGDIYGRHEENGESSAADPSDQRKLA
ncbi:mannose-1-phosphate guanylyltransferase/mannose-6-phosphate isomerase [Undibacterium cyanobacteriorum]|uniref:mannose-1-phosphate guanylyltransferase n=1 Tax=Undibacterium cyanobacteriorum TaxID=3073561 RepID=A0ABY9RIN1_9BURK|nr:mannose-1-phosphate guanylyltransferase/mannose-6-phosphate isomerase [Undibacterium sp. 20NA77.5]WMW81074.1 mannose-1-phosphate guanylyltransferase/mannose-6-phosphate isomerase [Undibacterium sp. 20NA77.5]